MSEHPTVVFFPEGAYGPTNNCVGMGAVLAQRGCRVVFVLEESFAGVMEARGFEERIMRLGPPPATDEAPGQFWKDFIREVAPVFRRPTIEAIEGSVKPIWQALVDGARYVEPRLREILDEVRPDVVVEDNVCAFPATLTSGGRYVRSISCNPAELPDALVPPVFSGYPTADRNGWSEFQAEYRRICGPLHAEFDAWCQEQGAPPLAGLEFINESQYLNLYLYPRELDYARERPLASTFQRLDSCVRSTEPFALPDHLADGSGPIVYLSLGSLGSADIELMRKLIASLADAPYRVVVSMGPLADQLELADNMTGAEFLPHPSLLPLVDLVITHGGNNTVTECLHYGKPMVLLPLFWDQHDNAQRVHETGFGRRLPTYDHTADELRDAIDGLLVDAALRARLEAVSARIRTTNGTERAADLIEAVARA